MFEQAAVAATHITDALRLLAQRPVEDVDDDLINFPEIRLVRAAAGPDIHAAIDQQLNAALIKTRNPGIAKQERAQDAAAGKGDHRWTDQHAIEVFANEVGDLEGQWIARRGQPPARVRSTHQLAQGKQNWSVRAAEQEVFQENGF